jgi:universal stress protein A
MSKVNRILVPVDFSDASRDAAQYAEALAQRFSAEVVLLHVVPPFHIGFSMVDLPGVRHEHVEARNRSVLRALESLPGPSWDGVVVRRALREGDAAEEIVSHAHDNNVDAIVMPTRGGNAFFRLLLMGSVTAKVLSAVECPVLTGVHLKRSDEGLQFRRILCAVDLGAATARVLSWGSRLAELFGSRLAVVHAVPGAGRLCS